MAPHTRNRTFASLAVAGVVIALTPAAAFAGATHPADIAREQITAPAPPPSRPRRGSG